MCLSACLYQASCSKGSVHFLVRREAFMVLFELSKDNPYTDFACGLGLPLVPFSSSRRNPYRRHGKLKVLRGNCTE